MAYILSAAGAFLNVSLVSIAGGVNGYVHGTMNNQPQAAPGVVVGSRGRVAAASMNTRQTGADGWRNPVKAQLRYLEIVRSIWGATLLIAPRFVLGRVHGVSVDRKSVVVTRILGARHLFQAGMSGIRPSPEVIAVGVWVDGVHSLTALGLAAVDRDRARGALTDAGVAAAWSVFGAHDLATATAAPDRQRGRDRLARLILARLPGGRYLCVRAERARSESQAGSEGVA